jgi:lysozyme
MQCNEAGLRIIKHFEGFHSKPYLCPAGVPTIGFGSTRGLNGKRIRTNSAHITEEEGEELLQRDVQSAASAVKRLIQIELNENELSALCSFVYNLGSGRLQSSTLRAKLNRGDYEGAALEFPKWRRAGGKILRGLVLRREMEVKLFLA